MPLTYLSMEVPTSHQSPLAAFPVPACLSQRHSALVLLTCPNNLGIDFSAHQGLLEVVVGLRCACPWAVDTIAAFDLGECFAVISPWAEYGTLLDVVKGEAFQRMVVEDAQGAFRLLVQWLFVDGGRDCALKAERVRGVLLLHHSSILASLRRVLAEHSATASGHGLESAPRM
jgi:hypothetical protein